jgi:hypothetical protein
MKDRIKEINHELWEIEETMKQLKKRTKVLTREKLEIQGLHKIERSKKKYVRTMGKKKNR